MTFQGNPDIAKLNAKIRGNTRNLPPVEQRLPSEPLIYAPYDSIGKYGGTLDFSQMLPRQEHLISSQSDTSTWFDTWMT